MKTVLIVDDEADILESLREVFEYEGYRVLVAADGQAALAELAPPQDAPCVAVMNVMMPRMTGVELFDAMQRDARLAQVSVIFCTSSPHLVPAGARVMKKPIDLARLVDAVRERCPQ